MNIDADQICVLVKKKDIDDAMFAEAIESFFNFDFQSRCYRGHFDETLLNDFFELDLVEYQDNELNWTAEILKYFDYTLNPPWDAEIFFRHICNLTR